MKISVVIPSFNHDRFLRATLDSVLLQDHQEVEVLVFDGGSTDNTLSILQHYSDRIDFVSQKDKGQADAINHGLQKCSGDILAYLNSDDVYCEGALSQVMGYFEERPDCAALYGDAWHLHEDGSIMEAYYTEPWSYPRLFELCYLCQPAVFWRREVIEQFGLFDQTLHYALDYDYWLRIGRRRAFHYLRGAFLAGSRLHRDTKTLKQRVKAHHEILQVVMRHSSEPPYHWLMNVASVLVEETQVEQGTFALDERVRRGRLVQSVLETADLYHIPLRSDFLSHLEQLLIA